MAAENKLFSQIDNLWNKSTKVTTKDKPESIYMTNRFLSLTLSGFLAATDLNRFSKLPEWAQLPFLFYALPKKKRPYGKYPKMKKDKITPKRRKALNRVCSKFACTDFHGLQIMHILEIQGFKLESD